MRPSPASRGGCSAGRTDAPSSSSPGRATTVPTVGWRHGCSPQAGARVRVVDAAAPGSIGVADLVIDAAYGTGFRGSWSPPDVGDAPVLAVDVPSGVDALTGAAGGDVLAATRTVTFAALKPGLLVPPGSEFAGQVEVADIGLDVSSAHAHLVQRTAVAVVAAASARRAQVAAGRPDRRREPDDDRRGGAGVACRDARRCRDGGAVGARPAGRARTAGGGAARAAAQRLGGPALDSLERFKAVVCGPGLGRSDSTAADVRRFVVEAALPMVVDGDARRSPSPGAPTVRRTCCAAGAPGPC